MVYFLAMAEMVCEDIQNHILILANTLLLVGRVRFAEM